MENEKCCLQAACGVASALIVFFLICMFLFPSVGVDQIESFIARHGSLIAGLIGFAGVIVLVLNQNKTTKILMSSQELDKAYEVAVFVRANIDKMLAMSVIDSESRELSRIMYIENTQKINSLGRHLKNLLGKNSDTIRQYRRDFLIFNMIRNMQYGIGTCSSYDQIPVTMLASLSTLKDLSTKKIDQGIKDAVIKCIQNYPEGKNINNDVIVGWSLELTNLIMYLFNRLSSLDNNILDTLNDIQIDKH